MTMAWAPGNPQEETTAHVCDNVCEWTRRRRAFLGEVGDGPQKRQTPKQVSFALTLTLIRR